jgi:hypothetical protein
MAVYTVHEPPLKRYETSAAPQRFAFVRDGFSFWAFLLAPLWMLRHRLWLVLFGYAVLVVGAAIGLQALHASTTVEVTVALLLALLIGFEAGTLRRFTLGRRGWSNAGIVVGDNRDTAERRFFDAWANDTANNSRLRNEMIASPPPPPPAPTPRRAADADGIVGLFPESEAPR